MHSSRLLIINADDLGYDPDVSRGILRALRDGVVSSATLMVNMPCSEEAARAAGRLAIGLHLNLARGQPAWAGFPAEWLESGGLQESCASRLPVEVVAAEVRAQLDRAEALLGRRPTHVDVHKHLHQHGNVLTGLREVALERELPVRALDATMRKALGPVPTNDHFIGGAGAEAYWTLAQLEAELAALPSEGITELMCHPGYRPTTLQSGYSAQREVELETFTAEGAHALLERAGVVLGDFRCVAQAARASGCGSW